MSITLANIEILYVLILIILPIYIIKNLKINLEGYEKDYLNKDSTSVIRGASVIVIFIHHLVRQFQENEILKTIFINLGFIAVSVFLFVSGYALMTQYKKRENYLDGFIVNKILRLFLTFLLSDIIITLMLNIFLGYNYGINSFIKNLLMFKFADGRQLWFVVIILYFYIMFYGAFKCFKGSKSNIIIILATIIYILFFAIINKGTHWYNTAICFSLGLFTSIYKEKIYDIVTKKYLLNLLVSFILFIISMYIFQFKHILFIQFIIPLFFIWLMITILLKVRFNGKFFKFMDNISFEFYLLHLGILKAFLVKEECNESIYVIISFILTIVICKILNKFIKKIYNLRLEKRIGDGENKK